jgi:hypothetical protein
MARQHELEFTWTPKREVQDRKPDIAQGLGRSQRSASIHVLRFKRDLLCQSTLTASQQSNLVLGCSAARLNLR